MPFGANLVRTGVRLSASPLAVVGLCSEVAVGRFTYGGHLVSQSHGITGVKGFRRARGLVCKREQHCYLPQDCRRRLSDRTLSEPLGKVYAFPFLLK